MVGLGLALGSALPDRREALGALALFAAGWLVAIGARLPDWKSDVTLAASSAERYPGGSAYGALAMALAAEGRRGEALGWYARALEADPPSIVVCVNAVDLPWRMGLPEEVLAMAARHEAAGCPPSAPVTGMAADALARRGDWGRAEALAGSIRGHAETRVLWGPVLGAAARMAGDEGEYEALRAEMSGVFTGQGFDAAVMTLIEGEGSP